MPALPRSREVLEKVFRSMSIFNHLMADEEEDTDTGDSPDLEEYLEGITKRFYTK